MWKPWSLYDWYYGSLSSSRYDYYGGSWAYYPGDDYTIPPVQKKTPLKTIRKDQLKDKKKVGISSKPPKSITRTYSNFVKALEQNDSRILASLKDLPNQIVVVKSKYLNADRIQEKRMRVAQVPFQQLQDMGYVGQDKDPYRSAFTTFRQNEVIASFGEGFFLGNLNWRVMFSVERIQLYLHLFPNRQQRKESRASSPLLKRWPTNPILELLLLIRQEWDLSLQIQILGSEIGIRIWHMLARTE